MRLLLSLPVALVIVAAILLVGLRVSGFMDEEEEPALGAQPVDLLTDVQRRDFAELLGDGNRPALSALPPLEQIPALELTREVRGFVQLEVLVGEDGRAQQVRVIDAAPAGIYERRAIEQIMQRRYPVERDGTARGARRHLEIVDFRLREPPSGTLPATPPPDSPAR